MSDILICGAASFVGSSLSGYIMQHTKYYISTIDELARKELYDNMYVISGAKTRNSFYLAKLHDQEISTRILSLENPKYIIWNAADTSNMEHAAGDFYVFLSALAQSNIRPRKILVLLKDYCQSSNLHNELQSVIGDAKGQNIVIVNSGMLYGPRQSSDKFIANTIISSLQNCFQPNNDSRTVEPIYIRDYFFALMKILEEKSDEGCIYNLFGGVSVEKRMLSHDINYFITTGNWPDSLWTGGKSERPDGIDVEVITKNSYLETIEHTIAWYANNKWFWDKGAE